MRLISDEALATLTIWAEAEGESFAGKVGVAEVIRNRKARKYSSDGSIAGTVALRYQFSFFNDDRMNNLRLIRALRLDSDDPMVEDCRRAWEAAMQGSQTVLGAVLYYNPNAPGQKTPSWALPEKKLAEAGSHVFFAG